MSGMIYSIIGTGAIGGYFGGRLAIAGHEVHFLLHKDYQFVKENGLDVRSVKGDFRIFPCLCYDSTKDMPKSDVVIVALKTVNNHLLKTLLPPLLKEDTIVLLIENGIGVEQDVQEMFPQVSLAAGLAFIGAGKTKPGQIDHQYNGSLTIASYSVKNRALLETLVQDLRESGVETLEAPYHLARWRKAVWNMPFNGMTVVCHAQTDELVACEATRKLIREQMSEVISAAKALGVEGLDEDFADKMIQMTIEMPPYSPSMRLDYDYHRPMEIQYLYSRPIEMARKAGFKMTCLEMLERQLILLDERGY